MSESTKPSLNDRVLYFDPSEKRSYAAVVTDTFAEDDALTSDTHVALHVFGGRECSDDDHDDVPFGLPGGKKASWHWPPTRS